MGFLDRFKKKKAEKFDSKKYPGLNEALDDDQEIIGTVNFSEARKPEKRQRLPKRKKPEPEVEERDFEIEHEPVQVVARRSKKKGNLEIEPIADVFESEDQLEKVLEAREKSEGEEFEEPEPVAQDRVVFDEVTQNNLLSLLFRPDQRDLKLVTNTPPRQFNALVIGSVFDRIAKGEHEGDDKPSVWWIICDERDRRAPSLRGESRHELVRIKEQSMDTQGGSGRESW